MCIKKLRKKKINYSLDTWPSRKQSKPRHTEFEVGMINTQ